MWHLLTGEGDSHIMKMNEPTTLKVMLALLADQGGTFSYLEVLQMHVDTLKPALTFDEQIERLKNEHAVIIQDKSIAKDILSRVNYYRLSAYGIGLKRKDNQEKYIDGISLDHLYNLYMFDSHLRSALLHLIEQVEVELKAQLAYHISLKYGPEGYRDSTNFNDRLNYEKRSVHGITIEKFDKEVRAQTHLPCVKHHNKKYGGHFPLWAAIELFTFGMVSSLYSIMKPEDQKEIAAFYNVSYKHLGGWIQALVEVRNICAHYGRLYNMPLSQTPYLFKENLQYRSGNINKLFPVLLVLHRMTGSRTAWVTFYNTLEALMDQYSEVRLAFIGFPLEWKKVLSPK